MKTLRFHFYVEAPDDLAAGIRGFNDTVTIVVGSGAMSGEEDERSFAGQMRGAIAEWFDGARVTEYFMCRCGHMDLDHTIVGARCRECDCARFSSNAEHEIAETKS